MVFNVYLQSILGKINLQGHSDDVNWFQKKNIKKDYIPESNEIYHTKFSKIIIETTMLG